MKTDLLTIPYVGKNTKEDLFWEDCVLKKRQEDRCQLYVFRMIVYYAEHKKWDQEKLKWWYWKDHNYPPSQK